MKNDDRKILKDLFTTGIGFPVSTLMAKLLVPTAITVNNSKSLELLGLYLIGSSIADLIEVGFRGGNGTLKKDNIESMLSGTSYSCFERHLLYDLPKFLYKKLKGR